MLSETMMVGEMVVNVSDVIGLGGVGGLAGLVAAAWKLLGKLDRYLDAEKEAHKEEREHRAAEKEHWAREERIFAHVFSGDGTPHRGIPLGQ